MNEAEKANQESEVFLKEVRLQNYKSIIDTTIDFKPGLNIIIGNNGSGKTNFLNYLYDVVDINWDEKQVLEAEFIIVKKNDFYKVVVDKKGDIGALKSLNIIFANQKKVNVKFFINNILSNNLQANSIEFNFLISDKVSYYVKILQHGVPIEQSIVEKPIQIKFTPENGFSVVDNFGLKQSYFVRSLFYKISYSVYYENAFDASKAEKNILELNIFFSNIKEELSTYTDIQDIRISPNFNLYTIKEKNTYDVHNVYLEFYINNTWMPYANLSDGSKRLFYIISEVISYNQIDILKNSTDNEYVKELNYTHNIILIEEPELGIHPHQLHKLMLFIKEQSKEKQIILTTHSPQVLNILGPDELDRIIICSYDQQKGTQLNHLTERQISKGQHYMQDEGFLSDYWVHSDLEPAN